MSNFVFREAVPEDKEAVLGMRDVYHGLDFLHNVYDEYMKSSHISSYLCQVNGEVVGFVSMIIVDNGEIAINRAARVRQDFEGKGVYRFLLSEVEKIHREKVHIKRHALGTTYKMPDPNQLCMERSMDKYTFTIETGENKCAEQLRTSASILLSDELPRSALYPSHVSYLFPNNRIVLDFVPFRLLVTNIPLLPKNRFASTLKETSEGTISGFLSAFHAFRGTKEYDVVCNLDVFGTDMETLEDHVAVHLKYLNETWTGFVCFRIVYDRNIDSEIPDKVFRKVGAEKIVAGPLSSPSTFLYERNILH